MMEGSDIIAAEAIIDNGRFGKRVVRFEPAVSPSRPPALPWPTWMIPLPFCPPRPLARTPRTSSTSSR